jgi:hypothetical protein
MEKNEKKKNKENRPEVYRPSGALDSIECLFYFSF